MFYKCRCEEGVDSSGICHVYADSSSRIVGEGEPVVYADRIDVVYKALGLIKD